MATTVIPTGTGKLIVTADYPYQAWDAAHGALRRNVRLVDRTGRTFLFEPTGEPRWPVAAEHYRAMARRWHELVSERRLCRDDPASIRQAMEQARLYRVRLFDAKTGCVTDSATMGNFAH
jgi:hypothetical protein